MNKEELAAARGIIAACRWMNASGLNQGTSGNISARYGDSMLITPSGVPYERAERRRHRRHAASRASTASWTGPTAARPPSGASISTSCAPGPTSAAIVHTHSHLLPRCWRSRARTSRRCHYMIAASGGPTIRCAATRPTAPRNCRTMRSKALEGRTCCLLANHGMIATGANLAKAQWLAVELETIARQYYLTLAHRRPEVLPDERDRPRDGALQELRASQPKTAPAAKAEDERARRGEADEGRQARNRLGTDGRRSISLVVGGGINGAGIARDAAGRGLGCCCARRTISPQGTSSRSGKLVHGGLRYLEYYEFRLVREALIEREVLLRAAPHIIWPMRFVLPHSPEQRPAWLIRLGLFLYDHLGGRKLLPPTAHARPAARRPRASRSGRNSSQGLRIFRLLGRRCPAGGAQRARRRARGAPRS